MKNILTFLFSIVLSGLLHAQNEALRPLDHQDFLIWNTLQDVQLSANGLQVSYRLVPGEGDPVLNIYNTLTKITRQIPRVKSYSQDYEGSFVYGLITPHRDSLRNMERRKIDKKKWPGDTLFVLHSDRFTPVLIPNVTQYKSSAKAGGWVAYLYKENSAPTDTLKEKKKSKEDLTHLVVRQLSSGREDTLRNVKEFVWAEKAPVLLTIREPGDSTLQHGVAYWLNHEWTFIKKQKGKYEKISLAPDGNQLAFIGNLDTTKTQVPPWSLYYYDFKTDSARVLASRDHSPLPLISAHQELQWSEDGRYLFYGRAAMPWIKDTTLLPDEIVDVEIWSTEDPVLYTVQNVNKSKEEKRAYTHVYDTQVKQHVGVQSPSWESATYSKDRNGRYALVYTEKPYHREATWMPDERKDLAKVDLLTGAVIPFKKGMLTSPRLSPGGQYAFGFSEMDSTWWAYHLSSGVFSLMERKDLPVFYNEHHDVPSHPGGYGHAGWIQNDQSLILYDRYDLWAWTPDKSKRPVALTGGRAMNRVHRYIQTDAEEKSLSPVNPWLIHVKDDVTKSTGYAWFNPTTLTLDTITLSPVQFSRRVTKARKADVYIFQKENFEMFPDLQYSTDDLRTSEKISDANPQQEKFLWGSIRLYHWMDWDSTMRTGLLVLPPGYDTLRTYPTIVNFYERSSDELHTHRTPAPHRSTINYAFYASRGYVIFNPDISYQTGLPGESAYQIVMSGVMSLVKNRIADPENLALQGHSWGGYQIAYILTRTDMFKCAEAGAAVVNMTSAYGGIRWESGRGRMFQYERTQSRLGKTLWDEHNLYISNSPLFKINKIETPLLLMHNDEDAAVPFEQGIEFYLALRRLDKKAWLLNYRGEPHWPVKWENRKDFNIRMAQFFDHYLKGKPMPEWMAKGVPAVARGIHSGLK